MSISEPNSEPTPDVSSDSPARQSLFREEVLTSRKRSLYGDVALSTPRLLTGLTLMLIAALILIGLWLMFGTVLTQSGSEPIWHWLRGVMSGGH